MRLITPALSWQLAASIVAAYDGPMDEIIWTPQTVTAAVLELAGDLSEHLRETGDVTAVGRWLTAELEALPGRVPGSVRKIIGNPAGPRAVAPAGRAVRRRPRRRARSSTTAIRSRWRRGSPAAHPEVGAAERARYHVVLLDEYQDTSHAQLVLLRSLFGGGHPVTAVGDPCQSIYGWRGASAGNLRRFTADFPVVARMRPFGASAPTGPAPVLALSTSFRNAARVLDAAAVVQEELRYEAPDVPRLVSGPDRGERGAVACALLDTVTDEAEWVAGQIAGLLALEPGQRARTGSPGRTAARPAVRPSDVAVLCRKRSQFVAAAAGHRGPRHPGRGGRPGRAAGGARGAGRGGHPAGAARRGRVGRAGPPAHRAALADRPARPGRPRPPRPGPGPRRGRRPSRPAVTQATAPATGPRRPGPRGRAGRGRHRPDRGDRQPGRGARRPRRPARLLTGRLRPHARPGHRAAPAARPRRAAAGRPDRRGRAGARPGHRGGRAAGRRSGRGPRRPGRLHRRGRRVHRGGRRADPGRVPGLPDRGAAGGVRAGDRPGRRVGLGQAAHRARGQGPAVAGRLRARPGPGGAVPGLPGPAPGLDPVDRQPAADPVRPARRRGGPARAARARRGRAGGLHRRLRGPGPGRGAPPDVRGRHPGRVLAGVFGLLVGRGRHLPPGPVAVPGGGALVRGGRGQPTGRPSPPRTRRTRCWPRWTRPTGRPPRPDGTTRRSARPRPWWKRPQRRRDHARARRRGPGPGPGVAAGRRAAAGRARATPRRRRDPGPAARPALGLGAGLAGPRPGRAGPAGAPADAPAARPAGPQGHGLPRVAGAALRPAAAHRRPDLFGPADASDSEDPGAGTARAQAQAAPTSASSGPGSSAASGPTAGRGRSRCRSRR